MRLHTSVALMASLLLGACAAARPLEFAAAPADPGDPSKGVRPASYSPVLSGYQHRRPTGPDNWRELNDRLSPAGKGAGS